MLLGLAGAAAVAATPAAPAVLRGKGDFRSVRLYNPRTDEWLDTVYWVEGAYVEDALGAVSHLMRDWREEAVAPIAPATIDIIAATQRLLDCSEPFTVISGYRTARTNAMLRRRSRGVAKNSYHVRAMAADLRLESRSVPQVAAAAKSLGAGGVGRYSRSGFVHLDCGPVREWGR
jgi:uncharacterized protein YcbK (DUF882 family)